jgi:hypothetical protein
MKTALTTMPKSTDAAFKDILERIQQQHPDTTIMALRALTWCLYARRPLHMDELRVAVVVEDGDGEPKDGEDVTSIPTLPRRASTVFERHLPSFMVSTAEAARILNAWIAMGANTRGQTVVPFQVIISATKIWRVHI